MSSATTRASWRASRPSARWAARSPRSASGSCGWNLSDRPIAYDFAINSGFDDADALRRYIEHPEHQAGVALWQEFATWVIADYEY